MKRIAILLLSLTLLLALAACGGKTAETQTTAAPGTSAPSQSAVPSSSGDLPVTELPATDSDITRIEPPASASDLTGTRAAITVRDYGTIVLELYPDKAPETVANFVSLAKSGFYDGLTFHRIIDGFMIQGGDPNGNGTGNSGQTIHGEFSANGYTGNDLSHTKGTISMARPAGNMDGASCQFFITVVDYPSLDGQYAAFGRVVEGMELVQKIASDAKPTDNNGTIPAEQQPVIESIVIVG